MSLTPIWRGRVLSGGLLVLDRPQDYARYTRSLAGRFVEVVLRRQRTQRSLQQNNFYFGVVVTLLAAHCGYEKDEMHNVLAMRFLRMEDCVIMGVRIPRRRHTPDTDTTEFSEYLDACIRLAAELGVVVPDPRELDLTTWTEVR